MLKKVALLLIVVSANLVLSQEQFNIQRTNINHLGTSFGIALYEKGIVYNQHFKSQVGDDLLDFTEIVYSEKVSENDNLIFGTPQKKFGKFQVGFFNGSTCFYQDEVFFTANASSEYEYVASKRKKSNISESGKNVLHVYYSKKIGDKWGTPISLNFNSNEFSCIHPFLSQDGQTLYFASNRPGSLGAYDLYMSKRLSDGLWSEPINLGPNVNTAKNEMFPSYYHGKLYFASNYNTIANKADILFSEYSKKGWNVSQKLEGLNSDADDFGIIFIDDFSGYFLSNRDGSDTIDQVYYFESKLNGDIVKTFILDKYSKQPIIGLNGTLFNKDSGMKKDLEFSENGQLTVTIPDGKNVYRFEKDGYIPQEVTINNEEDRKKLRSVFLVPNFNGRVINDLTGKPVRGMVVRAYDPITGELIAETTTNENGEWGLPLDKDKTYNISYSKDGFEEVTLKNVAFNKNDMIANFAANPILRGAVTNFITGETEGGVLVQAVDPNTGEVLSEMVTGPDGKWGFDLPSDQELIIRYKKDGLELKDVRINGGERGSSMRDKLSNVRMSTEAKEGNKLEIRNIYFDLGKANVKSDSYFVLDNIVDYLTENKGARIELSAHTDSRGDVNSNMSLSQQRAQSVYEYLVSKGVSSSSLVPKGYGESMLTNKCADGVTCTEEEHQMNRRVEMKILESSSNAKQVIKEKQAEQSTKSSDDVYVVSEGETLYRVYINTGVSTEKLRELNNLKDSNITKGMVLKLK